MSALIPEWPDENYRMEVTPLPPPEPDDYETELSTLQLIVAACSEDRFNPAKGSAQMSELEGRNCRDGGPPLQLR